MKKKLLGILLLCVLALCAIGLIGCKEHNHSFGDWQITTPATCTTKAEAMRFCECGEKEEKVIDTAGHNYSTWIITKEATHLETGQKEKICSSCQYKITAEVSKLPHIFSAWAVETPATCTEYGKEVRTCECGEREEKNVSKISHFYGNDNVCDNCGHVVEYTVGLKYTLSSDETYYIVSGKGTATNTEIFIPPTYNGLPVTTIGANAFGYCRSFTSINIPDSVTSIDAWAFDDCRALTSITIPDSVTSIDSYAFLNCTSLKRVDYTGTIDQWAMLKFYDFSNPLIYAKLYINGEEVTEVNLTTATKIGDYAFYNAKSITKVTIGDSVTSIGYSAFRDCYSLTSVTIGDSVTSIGGWAFDDCLSLQYNEYDNGYYLGNESNPYLVLTKAKSEDITSCEINESCKIICDYAFSDCYSLTSVTIGNGVTSIGYRAFFDCYSLTSVTIGDSVTSIGGYAFYGCDSLTSVTIGNGVTSIGALAFESCTSLTSVTIGDGVTSISGHAFYGCPIEYAEIPTIAIGYIPQENLKTVIITSGDSIGRDAFYDCYSLTSITIPNSVTSIGYRAFFDCYSLTSVTIGNGVTSIGDWAFYRCASLTSITFEGTVEEWNAISKGSDLEYNVAATHVTCTNGTVKMR